MHLHGRGRKGIGARAVWTKRSLVTWNLEPYQVVAWTPPKPIQFDSLRSFWYFPAVITGKILLRAEELSGCT